jgi:hypothetical protein
MRYRDGKKGEMTRAECSFFWVGPEKGMEKRRCGPGLGSSRRGRRKMAQGVQSSHSETKAG